MAVLMASDLHKDMAGQPLLRGVSFKLEARERMTVAGRNGTGKTTLLRMLAGEESIDRGEVTLARGARVALHDQRPPRERALSLRDYVLSGCAEELAIEAELNRLEHAMAGGGGDEATLSRYSRAQARLETRGGYRWRDRATAMVHGLGFVDADLDRALDTFSGGQLTRASLARALATGADVLLLDEPTNHLDIESLEWLEQTLIGLPAAVVLVAHDRWFLETVGTAVLELEAGAGDQPTRSRFFSGTWHAWRKEQAARELALGRAIERQQAEIARLERFVDRFRAGTRARQAQARAKKLDRMDRIDPASAASARGAASLSFNFAPPQRSGRVVFELEDGRIEIGNPPIQLLSDVELWLERGEHVSLVGPNGTGKTTLIETLAGRRELAAGKLRRGHNTTVGYLSQHADEVGVGGPAGQSVLEATQRSTGLTPNKARALLGRFLFSGEEAEKPLDGLSGGERRRLSLAILVHSGANVLILDEPTNHLDLESREALEDALASFQGSLLLVSHDRALLDAVGSRTVAVEDGSLRSYVGGWPEYVRVREERKAAGIPGSRAPAGRNGRNGASAPSGSGRAAEAGRVDAVPAGGKAQDPTDRKERAKPRAPGPSKNRVREQDRAERAVEEAEAALSALEVELGDPAAWATKYEAAKSEARHTAARRAVEQAYERLEATLQ